MQAEGANTVTNYGYDISCQIPEAKGGLCHEKSLRSRSCQL